MLHHRILRSIHRNAWRENEPGSGLGEKLLLDLRTQRSRIIWDAVKTVPLKRRRDENLVHSRTGNIREWEDVFIQHHGHTWRQKRDSCECRNDWDKSCNDFVNEISVAWGLPTMRRDALKCRPAANRTSHSAKNCASEEPEIDQKLEIPWESSHDRFLFVVDCQPLQRLVCGQTALLNDHLRPLLHRVLDNLAEIVGFGFLPPVASNDPVLWAKREHNSVADHLCNKTMDNMQGSWREERQVNCRRGDNVVIFSDGGTRSTCSASAWVLCVFLDRNGEKKLIPVVAGGLYFEKPISSFTAEAIALEHATQELLSWLRKS